MAKPFSPRQRRENAAFLAALHRTGNVRMSAREVGVQYGTIQHRRSGHPDFASRWDIALVDAHARFHAAGGKTGPAMPRGARSALRTEGGELMVVRTKSGRLQVRPACRGKLTRAAEQLFLQALSATANVRLSAAAAGASFAAFYRRQKQKPAFAREMRRALDIGYVRLECAAWVAATPASHEDDAWFDAEPPPMPQMSVAQALQLLFLHQKKVRLGWEEPHRARRRGESDEIYLARLRAIAAVEEAREAEDQAVRWALRADERAPPRELPPLPPVPPLEGVEGWSRASGKAPYHPEVALFGGWRIGDIQRK
ncbi:MAG TPA: hypothetical protein VGC56_16915 [Allosphingosinicella sp.]